MNDYDFARLSSADAYAYAMVQTPAERTRLFLLFKTRTGQEANPGVTSQDFGVQEHRQGPATDPEDRLAATTTFGWLLTFVGVIICIVGIVFDPSVATPDVYGGPSHVVNIGKLTTKQLLFAGGGFLFLAGVMTLASAGIRGEIRLAVRALTARGD